MKSIKKFENKKIQGLNETVLKGGGLQHTGAWGRFDSDLTWYNKKEDSHSISVRINIPAIIES